MHASTNALNANLARALRVRDRRVAESLQPQTDPYRPIGGPRPTMAWDAFWGAMDEQRDAADAAGMKYGGVRLDTRALPRSKTLGGPSLDGLKQAATLFR